MGTVKRLRVTLNGTEKIPGMCIEGKATEVRVEAVLENYEGRRARSVDGILATPHTLETLVTIRFKGPIEFVPPSEKELK